MLLSSFGEKV
ncbi:beta-lactamase superfamily domain protein, partial [Chlamydia psittaci 08DC60]